MQELIRIQCADFELAVWCAGLERRQETYRHTLRKRSCSQRSSYPVITSIPASDIHTLIPSACIPAEHGKGAILELNEPLFFENNQYHFEWIFTNVSAGVVAAEVVHRSRKVVDGFRFAEARDLIPARLTGTMSTANNVGWISLTVQYRTRTSVLKNETFTLEVLPSKMDLDTDLPAMYKRIDQSYPLWRFKLSEITQYSVSRGSNRGDFELMWLANFSELRRKFETALKVIENAPHTKLQPEERKIRAAGIKGRITDRAGMKILGDLKSGKFDRKYVVHQKKLSPDTPENRFVKMAVERCSSKLTQLELRLRKDNQLPDKQKLSDSFFNELVHWRRPLKKFLNNEFIKEAGNFEGLSGQETALQRKSGYSALYRCWQELRYYLDAFADESRISLKSVAEIYEVWCFLEIRSILTDELGFREKTSRRTGLELMEFYEYKLQDGLAGAFEFERVDGVVARLSHEPSFSKENKNIKSYLVTQRPDILLEIEFGGNSNRRMIWLFDAKYRIRVSGGRDQPTGDNGIDYVPDDALNQMHRYRDALIRTVEIETDYVSSKSRPVVGAFALYPGYFEQAIDTNPYDVPIREVGIGAFALLPSEDNGQGRLWLTAFLRSQIGNPIIPFNGKGPRVTIDEFYVRETARITYEGMRQVLYPDLVMTAVVAGAKGRSPEYLQRFNEGSAAWYHMPQARFKDKNIGYHVAYEIRYFGLAVNSQGIPSSKSIERLWPVNNVELVPRYKISAEQAGNSSSSRELYFLFKLGKPLTLKDPITRVPHRPFINSLKLTTLGRLELASEFSDVQSVYSEQLNY